jgi:hypothetical protein
MHSVLLHYTSFMFLLQVATTRCVSTARVPTRARRTASSLYSHWKDAYQKVSKLDPPKVDGRRSGKLKTGFLNGFATAACYAVASKGSLPADKALLSKCRSHLSENQQQTFEKTHALLDKIHSLTLNEEIGTWVGNMCSQLRRGGSWEMAADLSTMEKQKPIWLPHSEALKAVSFPHT